MGRNKKPTPESCTFVKVQAIKASRPLQRVTEQKNIVNHCISIDFQQFLLNIFKDTFTHELNSGSFSTTLQEIKGALYQRDFAQAFGTIERLVVYTIRWSPSRALCYQSILVDVKTHLDGVFLSQGLEGSSNQLMLANLHNPAARVVCIGGGAAEIVAFGGFVQYLKEANKVHEAISIDQNVIPSATGPYRYSPGPILDLNLVDLAQWQVVGDRLNRSLVEHPTRSKLSRAMSYSLLEPTDMNVHFLERDILTIDSEQLTHLIGQKPALVTFLFTLNELYATSVSRTTALLLKYSMIAQPGSILLIVDSAGSYSETSIGTKTEKYPMHWLLDYCLLTQANDDSKDSSAVWVKLVSENSKWFRIARSLQYPIPLEDMRYQIHLYKRL